MELGLNKTLSLSFENAIEKVTEELKNEGFGIITTIDFQKTVKERLNEDFRKFTILGACNPQFSHQAVLTDDRLALLMPCNVIIQEKDGKTEVVIFNPLMLKNFTHDTTLMKMSEELSERIKRVLKKL
jgi:uncharacterized protein (DUF302 family)